MTPAYEKLNAGPADESSPLGLRALHPDDANELRRAIERVSKRPGGLEQLRCRVARGRPDERRLLVTLTNRADDPAVSEIVAELRNPSEPDPAMQMAFDATGSMRSRDAATARFFGEPSRTASGSRLVDLVHPADYATVRQAWDHVVSGGASIPSIQVRIRRWDGEWRWIDARLENQLAVPATRAIVLEGRGVDPQRTEPSTLYHRNALLDGMFAGVALGLVIFDRNGAITYTSPRLADHFDLREGVRDLSTWGLPADVEREFVATLQHVSSIAESTAMSEVHHPNPEGDIRWLRMHWLNRLNHPLVRGVVCVLEDVTERRALESRYLQAQKLETIAHLGGGVAHDFNNLLGVILAGIDLIEGNEVLGPETLDELKIVRAAVTRAAALTRQLLGVSRPQAPSRESVDVGEVLLSMMAMLRPMLGENISVDLVGAQGQHFIFMERSHLEQVILNLCVNARDAMPDGGAIGITIAREGEPSRDFPRSSAGGEGAVVLEIRDTGVGMTRDVLERVLEPYFTTKGPESGEGLGLFLVQRIVSQARGRIDIESEPGRGTAVRLSLPASTAPASVPNAPGRDASTAAADQGIVLVVEDEAALHRTQLLMLKRAGYEVLGADSVARAIEVADAHEGRIDLLMTDLVLPDGHGARLARQLLEDRPDMKVLFSTGYAPREMDLTAPDRVIPILHKPYTENQLLRRLREVLGGVD